MTTTVTTITTTNSKTGTRKASVKKRNLFAGFYPALFFTKSCSPASCVSQTGSEERLTWATSRKRALTCAWSLCNPWRRSCQQWCYPSLHLQVPPPPPPPGVHCHRHPCVRLSDAGRPGHDQADRHTPLIPPDCKPFLWAVRAEVRRWRTPAGCK